MSVKKRKIIIIDGNALVHRSFHALPVTMTTKKGKVVNAVYGFASVLIKALREFKPEYAVLALDKEGPTFRHEKFSEYKAQRERAPKELYEQIPLVKKVAQAFSLPVFEKQGFEADDIIGTIVKKVDKDIERIVVTGDMDSLQLIDNTTKVYTMSRGLSESMLYDQEKVKEKFNLCPSEMVDFKALRGDPSDNIPGIKGIGEKTATNLIRQFGSLDKIYQEIKANPETTQIKTRIKDLLIEQEKEAYLSRELATIKQDLDIDFELEKASWHSFDKNEIVELFSSLEFKSLLPRLNDLDPLAQEEKQDKFLRNQKNFDYILVDSDKKFQEFLGELRKQTFFCFDVETTSASPLLSQLLGISFSWKPRQAYYLSLREKGSSVLNNTKDSPPSLFSRGEAEEPKTHPWLKELKEVFENENIEKIGHNIKFDIRVVERAGIKVGGALFDTMIASYLLNPSSRQHNLDNLVFTELGFEKINKKDLLGSGKDKVSFANLKEEKLSCYSCEDADFTQRLVPGLKKQLQEQGLYDLFKKLEMPLVRVLAQMENNGVKLDSEALKKLSRKVRGKTKDLEKKIWELAGTEFNINSPQQLKEIFFNKLNISTENISKTKTGHSTAASELEKLKDKHEIVPLIQEYREYSKLLNTYIDTLPKIINPKTSRIHTSFNQTVTATGRLSSTDPNLQNIPVRTKVGRGIRRAFVAEGSFKFLSLDYSQIELRLAAHMSGDEKMIKAFKEGQDIHLATAAEINGVSLAEVTKEMRYEAKAINFGILYGQGPFGLAQSADIPYARAKEFIDAYFKIYKKVREFIDSQIDKAKVDGFVETMWGRRRYVPEINSQISAVRSGAERVVINTPLQGSSADMIKEAMLKAHQLLEEEYKNEAKMIIQVHDELLFEVKDSLIEELEGKLKNIMRDIVELKVPIVVDSELGDNWGEMTPFDEKKT